MKKNTIIVPELKPTKSIIITSNSRKGENIFHCWNSTESFFVFTQRGKRGIDAAWADVSKEFDKIVMSVTHSVYKHRITAYYK